MKNQFDTSLKTFGAFVLRGRKQAMIVALIATLIPFLGWIGTAVMALVTLRKGAVEGFWVLLVTMIPALVFAAFGHPYPLLLGVFCGSFIVWIFALLLRETGNWTLLLFVATALGIVVVILAHLLVNNIDQYWYNFLLKFYTHSGKEMQLNTRGIDIKTLLNYVAKVITGLQVAGFLAINFINLVIARGWQARQFKPGGLKQELCQIRLNYWANIVLVIVIAAMLSKVTIAWDLLPVVVLPFMIAGISLVHAVSEKSKMKPLWLFGFYILLILFFVHMVALLVIAAFADSWFNFRNRIQSKPA